MVAEVPRGPGRRGACAPPNLSPKRKLTPRGSFAAVNVAATTICRRGRDPLCPTARREVARRDACSMRGGVRTLLLCSVAAAASGFARPGPVRMGILGGPDFAIKKWTWRGSDIRYCSAGPEDGTPVVLVHGFGASLDYYRHPIRQLSSEGYRVYALDLLGFGGSSKPLGDTEYGIELWKSQVLDFAGTFCKKDWVVAGNSIGGLVAVNCAADGDGVKGLLLFNCAGGSNNKFVITDELTPWYLKLFAVPIFSTLDVLLKNAGFARWLFERTKTPENVQATLQSVYGNKAAVDDELVESILRPADDPNALDVFVRVLTGDPGTTPEKIMPRVDVPTHLVWGDNDPFTPLDGPYGKYFAGLAADESLPGVTLSVIPNAGHIPFDDYPEESGAAVLPFLRSLA